VTAQTDPLGQRATWSYGADETMVSDPAGNVTYERFRDPGLAAVE